MKIALLAGSATNAYAAALTQELSRRGQSVGCVVLQPPGGRAARALRHPGRALTRLRGRSPADALQAAERQRALLQALTSQGYVTESAPPDLQWPGAHLVRAHDVNAPACVRALAAYAPDVIIYASGGILRPPLIRTAKQGVLNAHMAILPKYRGMNVLEWSLLAGDPLGVTVHFIDAGIDTGAILATQEIPAEPGDTIESLRARAVVHGVTMIGAAVDALATGSAVLQPNPREQGRQYYRMHPEMLALARLRLSGDGPNA